MDLKTVIVLFSLSSVLAYEDVTIVEWINTHNFVFLRTLIERVGLKEVLSQTGPYTFFAPTDDAFNKLAPDALDQYSESQLKSIIRYHVVDGYVLVPMVTEAGNYDTLLGEPLKIEPSKGTLLLNNMSYEDASMQDNIVNNGVIQPIDTVLMPPTPYLTAETLAQVLIKDDVKFKDILLAFMMADMINLLEHQDFTVFAPIDDAFLWENQQVVLDPNMPNAQQVYQEVLKYHIVPGVYQAADLTDGQQLFTLHGTKVTITVTESEIKVDNATIVQKDIFASNGFIHAINLMLVPADVIPTPPPS